MDVPHGFGAAVVSGWWVVCGVASLLVSGAVVPVAAVWRAGDPAAITAHAVQTYGLWLWRHALSQDLLEQARAQMWRVWARHRWRQTRPRL
jgi:hypothetical protein